MKRRVYLYLSLCAANEALVGGVFEAYAAAAAAADVGGGGAVKGTAAAAEGGGGGGKGTAAAAAAAAEGGEEGRAAVVMGVLEGEMGAFVQHVVTVGGLGGGVMMEDGRKGGVFVCLLFCLFVCLLACLLVCLWWCVREGGEWMVVMMGWEGRVFGGVGVAVGCMWVGGRLRTRIYPHIKHTSHTHQPKKTAARPRPRAVLPRRRPPAGVAPHPHRPQPPLPGDASPPPPPPRRGGGGRQEPQGATVRVVLY